MGQFQIYSLCCAVDIACTMLCTAERGRIAPCGYAYAERCFYDRSMWNDIYIYAGKASTQRMGDNFQQCTAFGCSIDRTRAHTPQMTEASAQIHYALYSLHCRLLPAGISICCYYWQKHIQVHIGWVHKTTVLFVGNQTANSFSTHQFC